MASEILSRPVVLAPLLTLVIWSIWKVLFARGQRLPEGIHVIGARKGEWFPMFRARLRNTRDFKGAMMEAYTEHRHSAVLIPVLESGAIGNPVVLPASETQFVVEQPDSVLDMHAMAEQTLQTDHTIPHAHVLIDHPIHHKVISGTLTNQVGNLLPDLADELAWGFGEQWGSDAEEDGFREVCVYETVQRVIGSVTNRVFVGLPHCRDKALLDAAVGFTTGVALSAVALRVFWEPLRPLAALVLTLPHRWHIRRFVNLLLPEIHARLRERREDTEAAAAAAAWREKGGEPRDRPNDFLEWTIKQAEDLGDPRMMEPQILAMRVLLLNFVAIHTSSFAFTDAVLDLASSCSPDQLAELRAEIASVFASEGGRWTKRGLARMERLDSFMRESSRLASLYNLRVQRMVVAAEGVTTPLSRVHLPQGAVCAVASVPEAPLRESPPAAATTAGGVRERELTEFDPFRFARRRQQQQQSTTTTEDGDDQHQENFIKSARNAFSATSNEYLAFGHGRYACPGRFFAAAELKLMLAHVVINYDIEPLPERPADSWFSTIRTPALKARIRIRRRKDTGLGV